MYKTNREVFVFKYLDLNSNEIEFIAVEDLSTCDWDHTKGMLTFVSSLSILLQLISYFLAVDVAAEIIIDAPALAVRPKNNVFADNVKAN